MQTPDQLYVAYRKVRVRTVVASDVEDLRLYDPKVDAVKSVPDRLIEVLTSDSIVLARSSDPGSLAVNWKRPKRDLSASQLDLQDLCTHIMVQEP